MKVIVTGGAGYIGSHTARMLRREGFDVTIYDNLSAGHRFLADGFDLVVGELNDRERLRSVLDRAEAVVHFAAHAYVGESTENPRKYFENNVQSGLNLLNAALDTGIRYFIFSSTCAVYGVSSGSAISEDTPREPINPYGASKLFIENGLQAYHRAYGLRYMSLRYFNAAGADESGEIGELHKPETHLIPLALAASTISGPALDIFGCDYSTPDGTCIRDYVHVNDLAKAHVLALRYLMADGVPRALNLGSGSGYSVLQVLDAVQKVTNTSVRYQIGPRRPGDPPVLVADPSRAREVLGWRAERSLEQMVSTAWRWKQTNDRSRSDLRPGEVRIVS